MTSGDASNTGESAIDQRPESDDYDLLTFGEVAARLSEELAAATAELERARRSSPVDPDAIRGMEERIQLLQTSKARYRQEEQANETYARRFGSLVEPSADRRPRWG